MALGAQHVGVPSAAISPAYSLVSTDYGKLRDIARAADAGPGLRCRRGRLCRRPSTPCSPRTCRSCCTRGSGRRARLHLRSRTIAATEPGAGGRRRVRRRRPRHGGQVPLHLGHHRHAQGGDPDPADALLQPGDGRRLLRLHAGRAAGGGRLGALEPHRQRQQGLQPRRSTTAAPTTSTTASPRPTASARRSATCARSRPPGTSTSPPATRCWSTRWRRTTRCARASSAPQDDDVRRRRHGQPHLGPAAADGRGDGGRPHPAGTGLGATETGPFALKCTEPQESARQCRHPGAGRDAEAGARGRQAGGAAEGPGDHARLLARARTDRRGLRRGGLLPARRRLALRGARATRGRASSSTGGSPRTSSCAPAPGSPSAPLRAALVDALGGLVARRGDRGRGARRAGRAPGAVHARRARAGAGRGHNGRRGGAGAPGGAGRGGGAPAARSREGHGGQPRG